MVYLQYLPKIKLFVTLNQYICRFQLMKLVVLLVFSILRHNDVITVLYWKYDFRFEIRVSKLVYLVNFNS